MTYPKFRNLLIGDIVRIPVKCSIYDGGMLCRVIKVDKINGIIEAEPLEGNHFSSPKYDTFNIRRAHFAQWELVNPEQRSPDYTFMDPEEIIDAS